VVGPDGLAVAATVQTEPGSDRRDNTDRFARAALELLASMLAKQQQQR
jgi:hypothetical protein